MNAQAVSNSTDEPFLRYWEKKQDGLVPSAWFSRAYLRARAALARKRLEEAFVGGAEKKETEDLLSVSEDRGEEQKREHAGEATRGTKKAADDGGRNGNEGKGLSKPLRGVCIAHYMTKNRIEEVILRLAARASGYVPVTINWDADGIDRVLYKIHSTQCKAVIVDEDVPASCRTRLAEAAEGHFHYIIHNIYTYIYASLCSTAHCRGVRTVTRRSRRRIQRRGLPEIWRRLVSRFDNCWSCAMTFLSQYTTSYWRVLAEIAEAAQQAAGMSGAPDPLKGDFRVVVPLVSRHIDFLRKLVDTASLPNGMSVQRLSRALKPKEIVVLLGSAPVGPTTVEAFRRLLGKLPSIRFGSTETCLQVMGTPFSLTDEERMRALERGWQHTYRGTPQPGYYIGRPHPPMTEVKIVKSTDSSDAEFMVPCEEGEPGMLICRGRNCMRGYTPSTEPSRSVFSSDHWYLGLGDVCFFLRPLEKGDQARHGEEEREEHGEGRGGIRGREARLEGRQSCQDSEACTDYYWVTRSADIVIKGGANYSSAQISEDIKECLLRLYEGKLAETHISVATVGMKLNSEHEDSCCVTVELTQGKRGLGDQENTEQGEKEQGNEEDAWKALVSDIQENFLSRVRTDSSLLPKSSLPDVLRIGTIPRNFKGLPDSAALKKCFAEHLKKND
ncbi:conserved hypothetical protein [Neospora caninum Liverpool]|uniref:AMP-dependent synthetase/ligase domain-containing protein n=1 Tax=Neospora caninum (strain Liverpool) TaxID=572307 RepID=F0V9R3_NEOCL|nr:conserved hypothetical protein [Neospora caninum Liverpool]CBZ50224.1 conserved hypothetical protein [Neospora caninum Liverpool]|eukprot:XP_003880259.1 conserved hypothetical protein [Neospora caninum Liverpool]